MRMTLLALVAFAAGATVTPAAAAPSYPWCANYSTSGGQCAFNTFEQCMEDVSGIGGSCRQNPGYQPPAAYNYAPRTRLRHNPAH